MSLVIQIQEQKEHKCSFFYFEMEKNQIEDVLYQFFGATTFSRMTFSIITYGITILKLQHYAKHCCVSRFKQIKPRLRLILGMSFCCMCYKHIMIINDDQDV
jgi:hypothetical protein